MNVLDLLARVAEMGGRVVMEGGALKLEKPRDPYWRERILTLLPDLAAAKCGLLEHFRALSEAPGDGQAILAHSSEARQSDEDFDGSECRECERTIWLGGCVTGRDVWRTCDMVMCPHFRAEYDAGGWRVEARRVEQWKRGKQ